MRYKVNIVPKGLYTPLWEKNFTRYQDAKRFAKEVSKNPDVLAVWIDGYEKIKTNL